MYGLKRVDYRKCKVAFIAKYIRAHSLKAMLYYITNRPFAKHKLAGLILYSETEELLKFRKRLQSFASKKSHYWCKKYVPLVETVPVTVCASVTVVISTPAVGWGATKSNYIITLTSDVPKSSYVII